MLMNNNKNNKYINVINMAIWWINKAIIYKIKMVIRYILVRFKVKVKDSNIEDIFFVFLFFIIFYYYLLFIYLLLIYIHLIINNNFT
jgi:hypothetical protein